MKTLVYVVGLALLNYPIPLNLLAWGWVAMGFVLALRMLTGEKF